MAKVKITNICKDKCVGFSFKMLKPGQSTVVDEERITEPDKRLIKNGELATMKKFVAPKEETKKEAPAPEPEAPKEKKKDQGEIISPKSDRKESPEIVTPENIEGLGKEEAAAPSADEAAEETEEEAPVADEVKTDGADEPEAPAKKYTQDELKALGRGELRKIGKPLGVSGRAVDKLVTDILEAQGNE